MKSCALSEGFRPGGFRLTVLTLLAVCLTGGCSGQPVETPIGTANSAGTSATDPVTSAEMAPSGNREQAAEKADSAAAAQPAEPLPELPMITFGGGNDAAPGAATSTKRGGQRAGSGAGGTEQIIAQLKDLQILLGTWRGITQKTYNGFKAVDETEWVWDFQTDPAQPALVMKSAVSPYYRTAAMTYLPSEGQYQLTLTDAEGKSSVFKGKFLEEIANEVGDDGKPQRTYKLELTEQKPPGEETARLVFNQQNNNRYLLEIYRQRGGDQRFLRIDTVSTQREGTSLAMIDEGYGEKTCIISGGLGTMSVSFQGQTYYVCCTGCKAAFEDDPERWIARANEQK